MFKKLFLTASLLDIHH